MVHYLVMIEHFATRHNCTSFLICSSYLYTLTLYMLNFFEPKDVYVYYIDSCQFSDTDYWNHMPGKTANMRIICCQCYVCWWPGNIRNQGISRHGIEMIYPEHSTASMGRVKHNSVLIISPFMFYLFLVVNKSFLWLCIRLGLMWMDMYAKYFTILDKLLKWIFSFLILPYICCLKLDDGFTSVMWGCH